MNKLFKLLLGGFLTLAISLVSQPVNANVNNFFFESFEADYYLSKDDEGRSRLKVVEKLVARFPEYNQNKGLVREIPSRYDGHPVSLKLESITRNGEKEPIYSEEWIGSNFVVSTGTDDYVTGRQEYVFAYTMRDVTKDFGDHQELYWDSNGTGWRQAFSTVTARLHLEGEVSKLFDGQLGCFQGAEGSNTPCEYKREGDVITFQSNGRLNRGENLTFVAGFESGSFESYKLNPLALFSLIAFSLIGGFLLIKSIGLLIKHYRSARGRGTIVPEYLPPKDVSLMMASGVYLKSRNVISAQLIDLAVRRKVQIIEQSKAGILGDKKTYQIKLVDTKDLSEEELKLLEKTTGLAEGATYDVDKQDFAVSMAVYQVITSLKKKLLDLGYTKKIPVPAYMFYLFIIMVVLAIICLVLSSSEIFIFLPVIFFGTVVLVLLLTLYVSRPLTEKGAELRDYLKGMEMYIKIGESERLKVLQSPQGAEKTPVDTSDNQAIVRLYERMLPYAVLFGQEKEWGKQLEIQYQQADQTPGWYSGSSAFQAGMIGSMLGGFNKSVNSHMGSYGNSSSSGVGGGGFSGGGGGGGGGGGR